MDAPLKLTMAKAVLDLEKSIASCSEAVLMTHDALNFPIPMIPYLTLHQK